MYRIDNSTAVATLPTPGAVGPNPNGYFTKGDPASGIPATIVDDDWANAVQEAICQAITSDGTVLSKTDNTQLAVKLRGRLLAVHTFYSSGTYTPTAGTTRTYRRVLGGGGGGGGAPAVTGSNVSVGAPGGAGSYSEGWIIGNSGPEGVTVGAGASGGTGVAGGTGGASISGVITAPGGSSGTVNGPTGSVPFGTGGGIGAAPTGGSVLNVAGAAGGLSLALAATTGFGGPGGQAVFGGAMGWNGPENNGTAAISLGCGGGGTCNANANGALRGGDGFAGVVIIEDYA